MVFRQNDSGRIYGVTFIDHDSRVVLNGSRLGKEYSANVFNERFSGETGNIHQSEVETQQREQSTHQEQPGFTPKADIVSGVASVLGAFGGLLGSGSSGGDEPQDTAHQKRKKKKETYKAYRLTLKKYTIMQQEDDLRGLARVMDFMRAVSILFVGINVYWFCYST